MDGTKDETLKLLYSQGLFCWCFSEECPTAFGRNGV